ncbi:hypothetical protein GALMADRAFT_1231813 [Galerina marginata CBS 339.88]|uniref:ribonuclease H n=1 Tax=Galerina marginata (strain CBS 339.88) TaxID=685588 RepID=A0A067TJX7_GALM3|nr:hypothetical protein GALMADRAFT_1231813 [Galerina marginata CBS 339.88]
MGKSTFVDRKFTFCPSFDGVPLKDLFVQCPDCTRFFTACCGHRDQYLPEDGPNLCHHTRLAFTDGACSNNGRYGAQSGLGVTIGHDDDYCWSIPVDDTVDFGGARTNQRAELLAAIEGLKKLNEPRDMEEHFALVNDRMDDDDDDMERFCYVVATDSEYVVKGITEWFPSWRNRGWRTSEGKKPANLDLFLQLDDLTSGLEQDRILVGFLHIRREFNQKADDLAKRAVYN